MLTADLARELLDYDPETGRLFWKVRDSSLFSHPKYAKRWNAQFAGKEAFTSRNNYGYATGSLLNQDYLAHRVIWLMQTGDWPKHGVDHVNRVRDDNRWKNLRDVPQERNCQNLSLSKANTSGVRGVCWDKKAGKWSARITVEGKFKHLGYFDDLEEAAGVRLAAEKAKREKLETKHAG